MAEEWVKNSRSETRVALDARDAAEAQLGALKDKQAQMAEQVKQALREKDSAKAGLKTTERQAEDLRKELHYCEINLATEKQMVTKLREELRKAREAAQLLKEATEAEKQAAYDLGVQETQSRLTEEFSAVARDYCDITWGKALDATRVPTDSVLRQPESIFYDSNICVLPGFESPPPEHPVKVSEVPMTSQVPPAPKEVPTDSRPETGREKDVEAPQGKNKSKDKGKDKALDTTISLPEQAADLGAPKAKV